MHLDSDDPHPHPHPHPGRRPGILPWLLIAGILGAAAFLALRNPPRQAEAPGGGTGQAPAPAPGAQPAPTPEKATDSRAGAPPPGPGTPAVLAPPVPPEGAAEVLDRFHQGVALIEQYNYLEAYERFAFVTKARPEWDAAQFNAGLAALNLLDKYFPAAEAHLRAALKLNPANLHARFTLGIFLRHQQKLDEAFEAFEAVARADSLDAHAQYEYGAALAGRQKYPEARAALEAAVRLRPEFASAVYRLASVYRNLGEAEKSQEALLRFKALNENRQGLTSGEIYGEAGKYYLALRDPLPPKSPSPKSARPAAPDAVPAEGTPRELEGFAAAPTSPTGSLKRPDGSPAPRALAVGDLDADGHLDLVAAGGPGVEIGKGDGEGKFARAGSLEGPAAVLAVGDLDGDGDLDLVVAAPDAVRVFDNDGGGKFAASKLRLPPAGPGFPIAVLVFDADSDWDLDVLVARQLKDGERLGTALSLLNNNRDGSFEDIAGKAGIDSFSFAAREALFADLDGDIDADLLLRPAADAGAEVVLNDRAWKYRRVKAKDLGGVAALLDRAGLAPWVREALAAPPSSREAAGSLALMFSPYGTPFIIKAPLEGPLTVRQAAGKAASWVQVDLAGPKSPTPAITWANLSGIGATVEARAGGQALVQQVSGSGPAASCPHRLFFDLGGAQKIDYLRILWPDGVLQAELDLAASKLHRIEEIQRKPTSCPIVFVGDGSGFRFVGDLLGAGGLGYLEAPGVYNRPDPTEVLELPKLAETAGPGGARQLEVRILEPSEECTYLDAVELIAVDSPAGVTAHPAEFFAVRGPAPGAGLFAFREPVFPERATDASGRDVTAALREVDRIYAEGWTRDRRFPGTAEPHSIILDWPPLPYGEAGADRPVLFLYGYVQYGYSTSNFAAAQSRVVLHAPTISVERGGRWVPLLPEWGFPAGTPRWMAVDLGGLLAPGDRRLRVDTDMEIYWDQAFLAAAAPVPLGEIGAREADRLTWSAPLPPPASRQPPAAGHAFLTVLPARAAALRYRGFPREKSPDGRHPRIYDYADAAPAEVMKPLPGRYTRYGDVASLLARADDRMAILAPGDEVALTFDAGRLPALEPGWKRTFFLAAVGYCKDADLYTAGGDRLDPLPFRSMSRYPPPADEGGPPEVEENDRLVRPLVLGAAAVSTLPVPPKGAVEAAAARRLGDYRRAKARARAWFDGLEIDTADLQRRGIKGKKKLAEILDVYLSFHRHAAADERSGILARVEKLAAQTRRPEYHNLRTCPETELTQNSMSYLRVAWLLERFGLDVSDYRREILAAQPRLDAHVLRRGPWQQAMFVEYYRRFSLARPAGLAAEPLQAGVISRRVPVEGYNENAIYDLTHEVFVAFDYGLERNQNRFSPDDLAYTRKVLPALAERLMEKKNPDLLGEVLSCMTYLGWQSDPGYLKSIEFLLRNQNPDGSWGSYEEYRKDFGRYLEAHVYLHTTMVVMGALEEAFEGNWAARG